MGKRNEQLLRQIIVSYRCRTKKKISQVIEWRHHVSYFVTYHVRLTLKLFKPDCEQQEKKWPEYEHQEHRVLTSVGWFFEIATNRCQLSTCVYTLLTGRGENMKEPGAHGTVGGLRGKEPHEVRNQQQEAMVLDFEHWIQGCCEDNYSSLSSQCDRRFWHFGFFVASNFWEMQFMKVAIWCCNCKRGGDGDINQQIWNSWSTFFWLGFKFVWSFE